MNNRLRQLLAGLADRYETAAFIEGDPSCFMHQTEGARNRETAAFLAMCLSYGSRKQFMPKMADLMRMAGGRPYDWVASGRFEDCVKPSPQCFYRLYTYGDIHRLLVALRNLLEDYGSLGQFAKAAVAQAPGNGTDVEAVLVALSAFFRSHDIKGLVPSPYTSACKRPCMFLRWMVRDGSPVDLGLWSAFIDKANLLVPLDTHVLQTAAKLKMMSRKSASWKAVTDLTRLAAEAFPGDPARADYALYGLDIDGEK